MEAFLRKPSYLARLFNDPFGRVEGEPPFTYIYYTQFDDYLNPPIFEFFAQGTFPLGTLSPFYFDKSHYNCAQFPFA
jgi:hypothetical protein